MSKKNAYAIIHFGDNIKYIELEIYLLLNLRKYTKLDIVYLYSINDTPIKYLKIFKLLCTHVIPYNDDGITYNIKFNSYYNHFNTLRTCNILFVNKLIEYNKVCVLESDLLITKLIDDIFLLNTPSIILYSNIDIDKITKNIKYKMDKETILKTCDEGTITNGGVILIEPSLKVYNTMLVIMKDIINNKCKFPNETLFLLSYKYIYNLPIMYNFYHNLVKKYKWKEYLKDNKIYILHFSNTDFRPIRIIKDNYKIENIYKKNKILKVKKIYNKYIRIFDKLLYGI